MLRNMYKDVLSASRIKFSVRRNQESYIHWKFLKDHGKRLVLISLDFCLGQMEWTP